MQPEQQQRIMGYFIEEAKDHLNTIEQGLLSLQSTIEDTEMMNEVFRAAHSVKGGAGMLGINSIHRTAHRLEDCLKVLQESPVKVDSNLESLFLQVFDTLEALVEQLQSPFGLSDEIASGMMSDAAPVFEQLNTHIEQLVRSSAKAAVVSVTAPQVANNLANNYRLEERSQSAKVQPSGKNVTVLPATFKRDVLVQLREMLQVFKQQDLPQHRQQLQENCQSLKDIGDTVDLPGWGELLETSRIAIACSENSYRQLASLVIKEIKQAQELALAGRSVEISPSEQLKAMAPVLPASELGIEFEEQEDLSDFTTDFQLETAPSNGNATIENVATVTAPSNRSGSYVWDDLQEDFVEPQFVPDIDLTQNFYPTPISNRTPNPTSVPADPSDPEVGIAELNSLADIFEGQTPDLDQTWQEEEIVSLDDQQFASHSTQTLGVDDSNDFYDLIGDLDDFNIPTTEAATSEDLMGWLGDDTHRNDLPGQQEAAPMDLTSDFSDLLFEEDRNEQQTPKATDAEELNNLFGDSFFDEISMAEDDTPEFGLDAERMPQEQDQDDDLFAMPVEALNDAASSPADFWGEELTTDDSEPLAFDDSFAFELEDLSHDHSQLGSTTAPEQSALTDSEIDFNDFPSIQTSEIAPQDELLFDEALLFDGDDLGLEELTFDDVDNLDVATSEDFELNSLDFDSVTFVNPQAAENLESMDLFLEEGDLNLTQAPDVESLSDFELDDILATEEPEGGDIAATQPPSALFWEEESPKAFDASDLELDFEQSWDLAENAPIAAQGSRSEIDLQQTSSSIPAELPGDFDLDDTSSNFFNFDEEPNEEDNLFGQEASSAVETPTRFAFDAQDDFGDLFAPQQTTDLDALTFEGLDLESFAESEIQDFDAFNDFFDAETDDTSNVEALSEFDEFTLFDTPLTPPIEHPEASAQLEATVEENRLDVEQTEAESFDEISEFLFDSESETAQTPEVAEDDIDSLLDEETQTEDSLNFEEDLFTQGAEAQEWDAPTPAALFESETHSTPQAQMDDLDAFLSGAMIAPDALDVSEANVPETEMVSELESELTDAEAADELLNWDSTPETENLEDWLEETVDNTDDRQQWNFESDSDEAAVVGLEEETAHPAEEDLAIAALSQSSFDDLEALLGDSHSEPQTPEILSTSKDFDAFDDLEALLSDSAALTGASAALTTNDFDEFDDLDTLLNEQTPAPPAKAPAVAKSRVEVDNTLDDDFGDLEKLLEQADKTMVGPATGTAQGGQQRPVNRPRPRVFEQTMRVPVKHLDSLSNLVGELVVNRNSLEQDQERLRQFLDNLSHQVLALSDVGSRMQDLYERSLLESSLLASRQPYRTGNNSFSASNTSNHSGMEYDPLEMDRFTGFHLLSQEMIELIVRVRESASDIEFLVDETDQVARMLRQVTTQLQEGLTRSRMVPFAQTADRLPRAVRDISQKLRKEAQLYVEGRETLIDKMILEHLSDPMTHLINNALTHGIETPEVRRAAGKSSTGKITLRAFHQGNQTVISVSDDGAGIDPERVRAKAIERKLITPQEAKTLPNLDLYNFLFHPGFTTKDKEDEYAGRGVGMDVVLTSMSEIRGTVHIDSTLGKGTTFTIRLPLTLSICKALCCLSDRARIAFPMDGVEDMLDLPSDRPQLNSDGQTCIQWRDTLLPFQPLSELLKYNRQLSRGTVYGGKREDDMISIVVLRSAGSFIAIQVDQVLGEQEIVIKQLEGPAPKPVGIAGATVLGDGRIMPIADVLELIDLAEGRIRKDNISTLWSREDHDNLPEEPQVSKTEPMVLIVDDSITVRELLSMTFTKSGYRVEQARDGQEAWDKLRSGLPCDIVFCDIEMPRMDGLELLSRLQKDETLCHLPIAMLTSRGADRHRQMASQLGANGYFTKPYLEEVLLEAASRMIRGEVLFGSNSNA